VDEAQLAAVNGASLVTGVVQHAGEHLEIARHVVDNQDAASRCGEVRLVDRFDHVAGRIHCDE
jgi:hypothetical protein